MGKSTKIPWCDSTWSPVTGCRHGCSYCYAAQIARRFAGSIRENLVQAVEYGKNGSGLYVLEEPFKDNTGTYRAYPYGFAPTLHRYRMDEPKKLNGRTIFVGSMCDLFGDWVPEEWRQEVFRACLAAPWHTYLFLTKNPDKYVQIWGDAQDYIPIRSNFWYGTSVTRNADFNKICNFLYGFNGFISFEPLLEKLEFPKRWDWDYIMWFIIGAETGQHGGKTIPKKEWIDGITEFADHYDIPVFMKDSLIPVVGEDNMRREFPAGLRVERSTVKMRGACMVCRKPGLKKKMVSISGKKGKEGAAHTIGQMCPACIEKWCSEIGFVIPEEWRTSNGKKEKLPQDG